MGFFIFQTLLIRGTKKNLDYYYCQRLDIKHFECLMPPGWSSHKHPAEPRRHWRSVQVKVETSPFHLRAGLSQKSKISFWIECFKAWYHIYHQGGVPGHGWAVPQVNLACNKLKLKPSSKVFSSPSALLQLWTSLLSAELGGIKLNNPAFVSRQIVECH